MGNIEAPIVWPIFSNPLVVMEKPWRGSFSYASKPKAITSASGLNFKILSRASFSVIRYSLSFVPLGRGKFRLKP